MGNGVVLTESKNIKYIIENNTELENNSAFFYTYRVRNLKFARNARNVKFATSKNLCQFQEENNVLS